MLTRGERRKSARKSNTFLLLDSQRLLKVQLLPVKCFFVITFLIRNQTNSVPEKCFLLGTALGPQACVCMVCQQSKSSVSEKSTVKARSQGLHTSYIHTNPHICAYMYTYFFLQK